MIVTGLPLLTGGAVTIGGPRAGGTARAGVPRIGITARRVVVGRPLRRTTLLAVPTGVVHGPVPLIAIRTLGPDLRPSPLARTRLVPPGPVVLREPVGRGSLVVGIRCAMPAPPGVAVPVRRAVPAATVLLRAFHPLLAVAVAIPGPVPTAGAPLVAGLVDAHGFEQRGRIGRPLNRY